MSKELLKQLIGAAIGILIGVMILLFGFFRTLLVVVLALLGWWLCGSRQVPQCVIDWLSKLHWPGR